MPHGNPDSASILVPPIPEQAPAEEIAYVICSSPSGDDQAHTICVIDVNPTSRTYSEILGTFALGQDDLRPNSGSIREELAVSALRAGLTLAPEFGDAIAPRILLVHEPTRRYGFVTSGLSLRSQSSAISIWYRDDGLSTNASCALRQIIAIADEPEKPEAPPQFLRSSGAVPALIADIALSPDDRFLYVACWGTGHLKQFDVSNPLLPREIASIRVGGITARAAHPSHLRRLNGGPATITVSQDGRRIYLTNTLSRSWEQQVYPDDLQGWMVKLDADPYGSIAIDPNFFVDFGDRRPQRVLLPNHGEW